MKISATYKIKKTLQNYEPSSFCCQKMREHFNHFYVSTDGRVILKCNYGQPDFDLEYDLFEVCNCPFCGEQIEIKEKIE